MFHRWACFPVCETLKGMTAKQARVFFGLGVVYLLTWAGLSLRQGDTLGAALGVFLAFGLALALYKAGKS